MSELAKGWAAYEDIAYGIVNFNFGGRGIKEARQLVQDGKMKWAMCQGGALTIVPLDYKLLMWEYFVMETSANRFEEAK